MGEEGFDIVLVFGVFLIFGVFFFGYFCGGGLGNLECRVNLNFLCFFRVGLESVGVNEEGGVGRKCWLVM